VKTINI